MDADINVEIPAAMYLENRLKKMKIFLLNIGSLHLSIFFKPIEAENILVYLRFVGRGLVTELDHDIWTKRRSLLNPAFHRQ